MGTEKTTNPEKPTLAQRLDYLKKIFNKKLLLRYFEEDLFEFGNDKKEAFVEGAITDYVVKDDKIVIRLELASGCSVSTSWLSETAFLDRYTVFNVFEEEKLENVKEEKPEDKKEVDSRSLLDRLGEWKEIWDQLVDKDKEEEYEDCTPIAPFPYTPPPSKPYPKPFPPAPPYPWGDPDIDRPCPFPPVYPYRKNSCPQCGLVCEGAMGYVCPHYGCPMGMGGIWCRSTTTTTCGENTCNGGECGNDVK